MAVARREVIDVAPGQGSRADPTHEVCNDPRRRGNRQVLCITAPIHMIAGIGQKPRQPQQQPEEHEHDREQAGRRHIRRPESIAVAAAASAIVVVIAQNIGPGGIHFGTN